MPRHSNFMILSLGLLTANIATSLPLDPEGHEWLPPTATDVRCPCPFTNTLANHGYIPRNGLNISGDVVLAAFDEVFNIDQSFTIGPVTNALSVSTTGINGTFNLPDVNIHNFIEHDSSLSRKDAGDGLGAQVPFDPASWGQTVSHFPGATFNVDDMAAAVRDRAIFEASIDANFDFTMKPRNTELVEVANVVLVFSGGPDNVFDGSTPAGRASTAQVNTFFVDERLPFEKGFVRPASRVFPANLTLVEALINATLPVDLPVAPTFHQLRPRS